MKRSGILLFISTFLFYCSFLNSGQKAINKNTETYFTSLIPWIVSDGTDSSSFPLFKPYSLTIDSNRNVYVLDVGNSCVVKYDKNGHYIKNWGHEGKGPGELGVSRLSMIRTDKKGNIVVTEIQNQRITYFDSNGKYLFSFQTERVAISISFNSKNNIYVSMPGNSKNDRLIVSYDDKGNVLKRFGQVFIEGYGPDYHVSNLVHDNDDNLYQVFTRFPYIRKYDSNDNLIFEKEINLDGYFNVNNYKRWHNYNFSSPANKDRNGWILFSRRAIYLKNAIYLLDVNSIMKISLEGRYIWEKIIENAIPQQLGFIKDFGASSNGDIYTTFIGDEKVGLGIFIY